MEYERDESTNAVIKRSFSTTSDGQRVEHVQLLGTDHLTLFEEPVAATTGVHAWTSHNDRASAARQVRG
jgi:hypothetical protein